MELPFNHECFNFVKVYKLLSERLLLITFFSQLRNSTKAEKIPLPNTENKHLKIREEVKAKRAEVMKELLIGYSESLKVVIGKTVSSFYQYFFGLNDERTY